MAYASYSTGFKSGAFATLLITDGQAVGAGNENLDSYEIGLKSTFRDGRIRMNTAVFYYDYDGIQSHAVVTDPVTGSFAIRLFNVGDAEVYGGEAELFMQLADRLEVQLGIGLNDNEIHALPGFTIDDEVIDGNTLPLTPVVNFNGIVRYNIPLGNSGDATESLSRHGVSR